MKTGYRVAADIGGTFTDIVLVTREGAIATKKTVNVADVSTDAGYLTALTTTRSELIVPVLAPPGEVVGTIDVASDGLHAFDADDQSFLEACTEALRPFWSGRSPEGGDRG